MLYFSSAYLMFFHKIYLERRMLFPIVGFVLCISSASPQAISDPWAHQFVAWMCYEGVRFSVHCWRGSKIGAVFLIDRVHFFRGLSTNCSILKCKSSSIQFSEPLTIIFNLPQSSILLTDLAEVNDCSLVFKQIFMVKRIDYQVRFSYIKTKSNIIQKQHHIFTKKIEIHSIDNL